jgi:hypothetical protein
MMLECWKKYTYRQRKNTLAYEAIAQIVFSKGFIKFFKI